MSRISRCERASVSGFVRACAVLVPTVDLGDAWQVVLLGLLFGQRKAFPIEQLAGFTFKNALRVVLYVVPA
jgi:hypothetical protein